MRMTEVITKLREVNPAVQEEMGKLVLAVNKAKDMALDATRCATDEGRRCVSDAMLVATMQAKILCDSVASKLLELDAVERSYTRKFESGASAPEEDPNQPELPGLEPGGERAPEDPELPGQDGLVDWLADGIAHSGMQSGDRHTTHGLTAVNNNNNKEG